MSQAQELQAQGVKLFQQQDYEDASRVFHEALNAYESDGQNDMVAEMQVNIGLVHRSLGENQQALDGQWRFDRQPDGRAWRSVRGDPRSRTGRA